MPHLNVDVILLIATTIFAAIAWLAEREALQQMDTASYHHVPLVRAGRSLRFAGMLCGFGFVLACAKSAPYVVAYCALICLVVSVLQRPGSSTFKHALSSCMPRMLPLLLLMVSVTNLEAWSLPGGAKLPEFAVGLAAIASVIFWEIKRLREQQDLVRIRD